MRTGSLTEPFDHHPPGGFSPLLKLVRHLPAHQRMRYAALEFDGAVAGFRRDDVEHEALSNCDCVPERDADTALIDIYQGGVPAEFAETIRTGWWTTCLENLPARERARGKY